MLKKILFTINNNEKKKLVFFYIFSILIIFLDLLNLALIIPLVETIINPDSAFKYTKYIPNSINDFISNNLIFYLLLVFNSLIILKNIFLFFLQKYQIHFISEYNQKLQVKLFKSYIYQSISNLVKNNIAVINRNVIDLSSDYTNHLLNALITILSDIVILIFVISLLVIVQPLITFSGLIIVGTIGISIFLINKKILIINGEKYKLNKAERIKSLNETFGAILEIKSFKKEKQFIYRFENYTNILRDIQIKISILGFVPKLLFEILGILLITLFFIVISHQMESLEQMIAIVALFTFAITKMIPLINKILINAQRIRYSQPVLYEIHDTLKNLVEKKTQNSQSINFNNKISLLNLDYEYEKNNYILKNLNLTIKKNEFIAITGSSGSGKSTLIKLILGLLNPKNGKILIDDISITSNIKQWQEKVSFVPQDVFILDDTLRNNITLETDDSKIDFQKLEFALINSNLKEYVDSLSDGFNTILGDKGSRISGGQKQRIGIARAMYADSEIIILDESTSAIQEESETKIFNNLKSLKNKTIIFVTHRKKIKNFCDKLYQIEQKNLKQFN